MKKGFQTCNEVLLFLMKVAYSISTLLISFTRFHELCKFLVFVKACITLSLYHDIISYSDLILYNLFLIQKSVLNNIKYAKFFGDMINESINISVRSYLMVCTSFVGNVRLFECLLVCFVLRMAKKMLLLFLRWY